MKHARTTAGRAAGSHGALHPAPAANRASIAVAPPAYGIDIVDATAAPSRRSAPAPPPSMPVQISRKCAACEQNERLSRAQDGGRAQHAAPGHGAGAPDTLPLVEAALQTPGIPLSATTRAFMEPRFGHSFGHVRVHTGAGAAASARALGAQAYTVGDDVVFAEGRYSPSTPAGRRLLAHELTHVIQHAGSSRVRPSRAPLVVGAPDDALEREADTVAEIVAGGEPATVRARAVVPMLSGAWEACGDSKDCPPRVAGERLRAAASPLKIGSLTSQPGVIVYSFDIGSSSVAKLSKVTEWATFSGKLPTEPHRYAILGFSDCEGGVERNTALRLNRATEVYNALPPPARARIDSFKAAPLADCVSDNSTEADRAFNRSVVFLRTVTSITFDEDKLTVPACPPKSKIKVTTISDYISLLRCAEKQMGLTPREMLTVFRQLYYGKPWSSVSTTDKWDKVITCSPAVGHPEAKMGTPLFQSLLIEPELEGVDLGHVFTGLEAMTCPTPTVSFYGGLGTVGTPNEDFATWAGDLGAAAAAHIACPAMGAAAAKEEDCGFKAGSLPLKHYYDVHAPPQDIEGDIDPYVQRAALMGIPCTGSGLTTLTLSRPISDVFADYYKNPTSALGAARTNRYLCFLQSLGASVSGKKVTNKSAILGPLSHRVWEFSKAFYTKIRGWGLVLPNTPDAGERLLLLSDSMTLTEGFLDTLAAKT